MNRNEALFLSLYLYISQFLEQRVQRLRDKLNIYYGLNAQQLTWASVDGVHISLVVLI